MRAGRLRTLWIVLRSVAVTLAISIPTILEVYRGNYRRADGDRRLRWWSRKLLSFVDLHVRVVDGENAAVPLGRPVILMSNHSSLYDIPLIFAALPGSIRMLTKKDLFRVPIWGRGLTAGEFVSIDRSDLDQAKRDLAAARAKMADGIILWVAPEGTRSRDGKLGSFKKGGFMLALETGATIVPIGIRGARDVLPAKSLSFELGRTAEVHVGRPIEASEYREGGRAALMAEVDRRIRELVMLPA